MLGLMQQRPLLLSGLIDHAAAYHGSREIVSHMVDGSTHRSNWATVRSRAMRVAHALQALGVQRRGPRRHAGLEHTPPSGDVFRGLRHGRRAAHREPAPVPGAGHLHHQPRRRRVCVLRHQLCCAGAGRGAEAARREGLCGDVHPCPDAGHAGAPPAVFRGTAGGRRARVPLAQLRREHRLFAVLHLGHHRQPERACCTATAPRCCIPGRPAPPTAWPSRRATACCWWCRCSM
jgi:hypothetical protein